MSPVMPPPPPGFFGPGTLTEEEKANAPKISKPLLKRIFGYLAPYWPQFLLVFFTITIAAVVGLFPSIITGKIVDQALVGEDLSYLVQLLLLALATMLASQIIGVLEKYINAWISQRIIFDMKNEMFAHLQSMPHSFFTTEKQGEIITRMNTDINGVSTVISGTLSMLVSSVATIVTTLVALFTMCWQLALVGLAVIPLLILPTRIVGRRRLELLQQAQGKNDEMNQMINETLSASGSLLVKMFTREALENKRFRGVNEEVRDISMKEARSGSSFDIVMGMFIQLGPLLVYFAGGFIIIGKIDPALTVGTVTAMVTLINRLYRPVEQLMDLSVTFTRSLAMFVRIFDYLDRKPSIVSPKNGKKPDVANQPVSFDHVSFGYERPEGAAQSADASSNLDGNPTTKVPSDQVVFAATNPSPHANTLNDVSFTVPGGNMFAIVGSSGAGKSTVVNLIPRLYDANSGSVTIGGIDVRDFDLTYLRQQIGMVTQETYLFNGTILENLQYAKSEATQEEIENACRVANIHDFICSLPQGYHSEVGNRGLKLSGGEKQRISLARVILKDPKILILDEATSALDSISESLIQDALEKVMEGRTSIVIAHRLSTILKADRILVVENGTIAEQGTHAELIEQNGTYKELYETQFREVIDQERQRSLAASPVAIK